MKGKRKDSNPIFFLGLVYATSKSKNHHMATHHTILISLWFSPKFIIFLNSFIYLFIIIYLVNWKLYSKFQNVQSRHDRFAKKVV